jgi:hypothetical protein
MRERGAYKREKQQIPRQRVRLEMDQSKELWRLGRPLVPYLLAMLL